MIGVDGMQMPKEYYVQRELENLLTGAQRLTFTREAQAKPNSTVTGQAASLLFADIASAEDLDAKRKTVFAASSRLFMDALQTPKGLESVRNSTAFTPSRFNGNAWLEEPSEIAWKLGAVRWSYARDYATRAGHLVIAGETARIALGSNFAMHPAFAQIEGIARIDNWPVLLSETAEMAGQCSTMVAPNRERQGLDIIYWTSGYDSPIRLEIFAPSLIAQGVIDENQRDRGNRTGFIRKDYEAHGDRMADKLKGYRSFTGTDFINLILPLEFQIALAYEGLYHSHTDKRRTANPTVNFAGSKERVYTEAWSQLFNNLVARGAQIVLPAGQKVLKA